MKVNFEKVSDMLTGIFLCGIAIGMLIFAITGMIQTFSSLPTDCGMCGAHVHDYWYVSNDAHTGLIKVCEHCYLDVRG